MSDQFGAPAGGPANKDWEMASAESLVLDISTPDLRENALLELSKEISQDLAAFVWNSFGTIAALIQEDPTTRRWLQQLLHNVGGGTRIAALQAGGAFDHMM